MKTLDTIQKLSKIGKILSKIVYICCIVGLIGCAVGAVAMCIGAGTVKIGGSTLHESCKPKQESVREPFGCRLRSASFCALVKFLLPAWHIAILKAN